MLLTQTGLFQIIQSVLDKSEIYKPNLFYMLLLLAATFISISIAMVAWKRRQFGQVASTITLFMAAVAWWALTYALHWSGVSRLFEHFWLNATYLGVVLVPTTYFAFALHFTGNGERLTKRVITILAIEPLLTLCFLWTDKLHGLFFAGNQFVGKCSILDGGIWFWVNAIYSYLIMLMAVVVLLRFFRKCGGFRRKQILVVLAGALVPWAASIISLAGPGLVYDLDLTPFAFIFTGAAFAYALSRLNLLSIVPVARDALVEIMTDGFFVVDLENRVVDINLAAQEFLGISKASIGRNAEELFKNTPELVKLYRDVTEGEFEFFTGYYGKRHLHMQVVPLFDNKIEYSGRLFIFRDVTEKKMGEIEIQKANSRLTEQLTEIQTLQMELRKQAIRDPLTNLYNRRYLEEFLDKALAASERDQSCLSVLIVDIDHFKKFNDEYGHRAGDAILRRLGELMLHKTRKGDDIACRYGGEEFVIVLANTVLEDAVLRAEGFRSSFEALKVSVEENDLSATVSIGVAVYPFHGTSADELLHAADNALYRAKEAGRNCIKKARLED